MLLIMAFPLVLMWIGRSISRIDGILLIGVFVLHSWRMLRNRKKFRKKVKKGLKKIAPGKLAEMSTKLLDKKTAKKLKRLMKKTKLSKADEIWVKGLTLADKYTGDAFEKHYHKR